MKNFWRRRVCVCLVGGEGRIAGRGEDPVQRSSTRTFFSEHADDDHDDSVFSASAASSSSADCRDDDDDDDDALG